MKKIIIDAHKNWFTTICGYVVIGYELYNMVNSGTTLNHVNIIIGCALIGSKDTEIDLFKKKQ